MKKTLRLALALALILSTALTLLSCSLAEKMPWNKSDEPTYETETKVYDTDTTLGEGAKTLTVRIEDPEKSVTFTIHTDADTVGAALIENGLITGEEGAYGLYIKVANGTVADYDIDQSYWAFYVDGEYAMSGVDTTEIEEGVIYSLVYTK